MGGTVHPPLCEDVRHLCRMSEGYADDGRMPGAYGGLCRVSERYTLRGLVRHDLDSAACLGTPASLGKWRQDAVAFAAFPWGTPQPVAVLADGAEPLPRFWWGRPADAVIVDGAEPLPPVWGDVSAPDPAFRMTFAACLGYALKISSETGSPALAACLGGTLEESGLPGKGRLGQGQCFGGFQGAGGP